MRTATVEVTVRVPVLITNDEQSFDAEALALALIREALDVDERLGIPEMDARCVDLKTVEDRVGLVERLMMERPAARQWGIAWVVALFDRRYPAPKAADYGLTQQQADDLADALDYTVELAADDHVAVASALAEVR